MAPRREVEHLDDDTRECERLMLGLRLDEPLRIAGGNGSLDLDALQRLAAHGLVELIFGVAGTELRLTRRGRFLGGAVTAELVELAAV
jgi:coproporphyrinogen III oxidase-like Fe-S oxidoreductase